MSRLLARHHASRLGGALVIAGWLVWNTALADTQAARHGDVRHGQHLYEHYCIACHGIEGTGTGPNAPYLEDLGRAPRDHTDIWYMNRLTDAEIYDAISAGKRRPGEPPFMPWWGLTLSSEDIWDLVAFIRHLAREPAN